MTPSELQRAICKLQNRQLGKVAEIIVSRVWGHRQSNSPYFDLGSDTLRLEVKFSAPRVKTGSRGISLQSPLEDIERVSGEERRCLGLSEIMDAPFESNFNSIKRNEFDHLTYGLFLSDTILVFSSPSSKIHHVPRLRERQMLGANDVCQFTIDKKTIRWHLENSLLKIMDYQEALEILEKNAIPGHRPEGIHQGHLVGEGVQRDRWC